NGGSASFTETSANATTWVYDYGDGSPLDTVQNGQHTYTVNGDYVVCITAISSCTTATWCDTVSICLPVSVSFATSVNGTTASFTETSANATTWVYDYGDGSPLDTVQNGQHTYAANGDYLVCITAISSCTSVTWCDTVSICTPVIAYFTWIEGSASYLFSDSSQNATSWSWDFGDGSPVDTNQNTTHLYQQNGIYTVCLIASNECSSDTFCTTIINCMFPVNAAFTASGTGFNYSFTNGSLNAASYFWDFDDNGATSTQTTPSHTFSFSGQHIVCLTSIGFCGDSVTVCDTVVVQIVGVHETNFGSATISVFPNPMSDAAMLLVQSAEFGGVFTLELMDVSGKIVRTENGMFNEAHAINRGELAAGLYGYRIVQNGIFIGNGKLIIQ
ncbi:MAG: PKD domain-containing protein, partial [Bacteroidia bacterium]